MQFTINYFPVCICNWDESIFIEPSRFFNSIFIPYNIFISTFILEIIVLHLFQMFEETIKKRLMGKIFYDSSKSPDKLSLINYKRCYLIFARKHRMPSKYDTIQSLLLIIILSSINYSFT